ncbi:MAG: hypothetical protein AABY18_07390 [Candidatus Thermoplasmatota archaeon]
MSVHVACSTCRTTFPVETHAGLVRCDRCEAFAAPRMSGAGTTVVEFDGIWA